MTNIFTKIHDDLSEDLALVNELILAQIISKEQLVTTINDYLINAGGKRIRPILTLLSSKMFGYKQDLHIKLAAAVEFIHTATLLHDDVVDNSNMRRFKPTVNSKWGNKASILVGDFLFSQAFKLMVETNSMLALNSLAQASVIIAEGEVMQLAKLNEHRMLTLSEYEQIIQAKTAELFGAACEVGAIIGAEFDSKINSGKLKKFGILLGNIFQVSDDLLDYFGEAANTGKENGADFLEGKITLPLILLNVKLTESEQSKLSNITKVAEKNSEDLTWIIEMLIHYNIKFEIENYITTLKKSALTTLKSVKVEDNIYKKHLIDLVEFAATRLY